MLKCRKSCQLSRKEARIVCRCVCVYECLHVCIGSLYLLLFTYLELAHFPFPFA